MALDFNQVTVIGRLTKDVDFRSAQSGTSVAKFTVACNGYKDTTDFLSCTAFNKTAEILNQYTRKGSRVAVSGRMHSYSYDKQDGSKAYITEISVSNVQLLDSKSDEQKNAEPKPNNFGKTKTLNDYNNKSRIDITDDDLPF